MHTPKLASTCLPMMAACLCVCSQARAQEADANTLTVTPSADAARWRVGVALGYGERDNPLVYSEDLKILVDLDIAWFGDRWFFDNGDGGFTLLDNERFTLNVIGRFNSDRVFFSKTDTDLVVINLSGQAGVLDMPVVPGRDYAIELGLELLSDGDWGQLQLAAHRDASGTHDGYEVYVDYGHRFQHRRWLFEPSVGFAYKSRRSNDYYWGLREHEASVLWPAYTAGAGVNQHARFAASYRVDRHWSVFAVAEVERLNAEAARSPLVAQRDLRGVFAGFHYRL